MKTTIRAVSAVLAMAFGIFAFGAAPAGAQTDPYVTTTTSVTTTSVEDAYNGGCAGPTITISVAQTQRGAKITVNVACFKLYGDVTVTMFSTPTVLGTLKADGAGAGAAEFTIPCDKEDGVHTITADGIDGEGNTASASAAVTVSGSVCAAQQNNAGNNSGTNNLARTGATVGIILAVGSMLLLAGYIVIRKANALNDEV